MIVWSVRLYEGGGVNNISMYVLCTHVLYFGQWPINKESESDMFEAKFLV